MLKRTRGPDAVANSLIRGFKLLAVPYQFNYITNKSKSFVYVISGSDTLKWAIKEKEKGHIKYLATGPNIVILPNEEKKILLNKNIDKIILPSLWTKDLFFKLCPELKNKDVIIWPAGVDIPKKINIKRNIDFLVLDKRKESRLLANVRSALKAKSVNYRVITYGKFSQKKYYTLLNNSKYLICLGRTESQGLALFEAWAYNVPTIVYEEKTFNYKNITWDRASAAPYLHEKCGIFFKTDFKAALDKLANKSFSPRAYCLKNYSDEIMTKQFLEIARI
ncbi:MAG: hypothetical protein KKA19_00945 [Candidatus Margulisbacteria bacterium]|nr:hypothetical protein [Candidatus Margulisiibacteriota bacterium]